MSVFLSNPRDPSATFYFITFFLFFPLASPPRLLPLLLSSLLSAACCTVWVPLWGLHTVCMCLGWQTGLTHLPGAFPPPPPPSLHPSLPCRRLRCAFVCVSIHLGRLVCTSVPFVCPSHFPSLPVFPSKMMAGGGILSHLHLRECFTGCHTHTHTHTHSRSLLETHTRRECAQRLKIEDGDRRVWVIKTQISHKTGKETPQWTCVW